MANQDLELVIERDERLMLGLEGSLDESYVSTNLAHTQFMETYDQSIEALETYLVNIKRAVDLFDEWGLNFSNASPSGINRGIILKCNKKSRYFKDDLYILKIGSSGDKRILCKFDKDGVEKLGFSYDHMYYHRFSGDKSSFRKKIKVFSNMAFLEMLKGNDSSNLLKVLEFPTYISKIPDLVSEILSLYHSSIPLNNQRLLGKRGKLHAIEYPNFPELK
ncbi:hypothetical protein HQ489_01670 [Candidatus Woesearchaeota archaeon]|nr:hypothetical protein [Candidatus Woesearchaeota archaeon]